MTSQPTTKGGNIILKEFTMPDGVMPGESITAEVEVANGALAIGPFDPDRCGTFSDGYKTQVVLVKPDGSEERSATKCIKKTEVGTKSEFFSFTFSAPETPGDHQYQAYVEMVGSGKTTDRVTESVNVTEQSPTQPSDPANDPDTWTGGEPTGSGSSSGGTDWNGPTNIVNGGGGSGGGLLGGGSLLGGSTQTIVVLIIIVIALGALGGR